MCDVQVTRGGASWFADVRAIACLVCACSLIRTDFCFQIWEHRISEDPDGRRFVEYRIRHSWRIDSGSTFVWRRFSELNSVHTKLSQCSAGLKPPSLVSGGLPAQPMPSAFY